MPESRPSLVTTVACLAAAVVVAVGAVYAVGAAQEPPAPRSFGPEATRAEQVRPPGERLVPRLSLIAVGSAPAPAGLPLFEVLPDGAVVAVPTGVGEHTAVAEFHPAADDSLIVRADRDLLPGVDRPDGPFTDGLAQPLLVVGPDGSVRSDDDVRVRGESITLLTASDREAVLQRAAADAVGRPLGPPRLVARDLATGVERELAGAGAAATDGDLEAGLLALAGGAVPGAADRDCWLRVLDPAATDDPAVAGATAAADVEAAAPVALPGCDQVLEVNLAPDGHRAAVVTQRHGEHADVRLRVVDVRLGTVVADVEAGAAQRCTECVQSATGGFLGTAWSSPTTVHVARLGPLPLVGAEAFLDQVRRHVRVTAHTVG